MALNGLGPRAVRRVARATGLDNIVRATVLSHDEHWLVMLTLDPHQHMVWNRRTGDLAWDDPGPSPLCTWLCGELFPDEVATSEARL